MIEILSKNDQKKIEGFGLTEEAISIIENCDCGIINYGYIHDLSKMRKWEIMEVVGNYLDNEGEFVPDWTDIKRIATFCKAFDIKEEELSYWYALGICEGGFSIAYRLNEDIVLILEDKNDYPQWVMPEEEPEEELIINGGFNMIYTQKLDGDERFAIDNIEADLWNEGWDVLEDDSGCFVIESDDAFKSDDLTSLFRIYISKNKAFLMTCDFDSDGDMVFKVYEMALESYKNEWKSIISEFKPAEAIEFNRGYEIALTDSNGFILCHFEGVEDVEEYAKANKLAINWSKFEF